MPIIHEVATMTAKGQITLPKPIRQVLGVDVGAKVAFELHDNGRVIVSRADAEHEDPAIGAFLDLLADDIQAGRHLQLIEHAVANGNITLSSDYYQKGGPVGRGERLDCKECILL